VHLHARKSIGLTDAAMRSLTLLRMFLLASAAILVVAGLVLSSVLTSSLTSQAVSDRRQSLTQYVDGVLRPDLVHGDRIVVGPSISSRLLDEIRRQPDIVTVKVWRADGTLAWTNRGLDRIGKRFPLEEALGDAIHENRPQGSIGKLEEDENEVEAKLGFDRLLQLYAPVSSRDGTHAIGAYEIYANPRSLESSIASRKHLIWLLVAVVFLALYGALALLVRGASSMLRQQTMKLRERSRELLESYRRLEESSLEAVESLNATVEAKDPYTAGHSLRVQQIALAVGEQLGLSAERMDALRYGSLFHDIGKLAVPDVVLMKPARLSAEEFELIKLHSDEGARIVGKLGRLRDSVPVIRHHHEWWDGKGYPDGRAGEDIPLEAAITGLADAWDAMTTDRPYHRGLSTEEAFAQIRDGRGTQFAPSVVDAFLAAARRRPEILLSGSPETSLQALAS
jgi:putative nucleotidyltransferase with HDIG domain